MPAKFCYQHLNRVIKTRNYLLTEAHEILGKYEKNIDYWYKEEYLKNLIGLRLYEELISTTTEFIKSMDYSIIIIYQAFEKMSFHIRRKYRGYEPLELDIDQKLKPILDEKKSTKSK